MFLLASIWNYLQIILQVTLFRKLVPTFRQPPVILKIDPKAGTNEQWRKSTNERQGKPEQKFDVAFGTVFRISIFFQRSKLKLSHFSL